MDARHIGVTRERTPGENRVALTPDAVKTLRAEGEHIMVERGAGAAAGIADADYDAVGATLVDDAAAVHDRANVICRVRILTPEADRNRLRAGRIVVGLGQPWDDADAVTALAETGVTAFALELLPRITRAQSMDVLSSQANIAGYKAVLLAAARLNRFFPMLMTAAGTVTPARVLVIGAGVAGLQAIATARRLGAVVIGYDIRPAVREQVESLGARFLELEAPGTDGEDRGGYARALTDEQLAQQQAQMEDAIAQSDVVITTAAVPGRPAPRLVPGTAVERMRPGSVIVDLAAERGGNCELTRPDEEVLHRHVLILGPTNLPATLAADASRLYARNLASFLKHLRGEELTFDPRSDDEIVRGTLLTHDGRLVHPRIRNHFKLDADATRPLTPAST